MNKDVKSNEVIEETLVNGARVTIKVHDINALKKAVSNAKYINIVAMKLDLTSIDKSQDTHVPFILKFENKNIQAKNPKGSKSSKLVH
jgi:hypothetical protein